MPLIPALRRQKQVGLYEFKAYLSTSEFQDRAATQRNPVLKHKKIKK